MPLTLIREEWRLWLNLLPRHFDVFELGKVTIGQTPEAALPKVHGSVQSHGRVRLLQQGETGCEDPGRVAYP